MIITCLYAMLMMMVVIGIVLQILEDGWLAPSSLFTVVTFSIFFVTAALHPQEINCLLSLVVYYITIPSMYMLLIIYSLCNLNDVSWGTREVPQSKSEKELEAEKKEAEEAKKKMDTTSLLKWFGNTQETSGSIECGVAGVFKCMCCTNPKDHKEDLHLLKISTSLEKIENKLNTMGAEEMEVREPRPSTRRRSSMAPLTPLKEYDESISDDSTDVPREDRDDQVNPYWIEDPDLLKGDVDFLSTAETKFWKDLIDTYLEPLNENKEEKERIIRELKNLRDTMVFAFFMLNSLFVLVVFLLQLNQDQVHMRWPLGQKVAVNYDDEANIVYIDREYLMLEPIGLLFLAVFGSVMLIQFTAMLFHRLATLTHFLATTNLNWYCSRQPEEMTPEAILDQTAVTLAKQLQKWNGNKLEMRGVDEEHVSKRKTVHNLEIGRTGTQTDINLDKNFRKSLRNIENTDIETISRMSSLGGSATARRATLRAIISRRDSITAERRRSQAQLGNDDDAYMYGTPGSLNASRRASNAGAFTNVAYEPALDLDDEPAPLPRRSTVVRFRDPYNTYFN